MTDHRAHHPARLETLSPGLVRVTCPCRWRSRSVGDWDEERAWRLHEAHTTDEGTGHEPV